MAAEGRRSGPALEETLREEAYRFEFFQAVRVLERLLPGRAPVGRHDTPPGGEVVRFRTRPTLQFPPSEVFEVSADGDGGAPAEMTVSFMGLTGPVGVLPSHATELVAERARSKDTALWEFLDLFSHRLVSLFYRAWERYRFTVAFERGAHDELTGDLFALVGMGTRGLRGRLGLPDERLIFYGGLIAQRPHSGSAAESLLGDYFGVPVRLEPFAGQWLELDEGGLTRLGAANSRLGFDTVAGARVWDAQSKFRLHFGPLTLAEFEAFLPAGRNYRAAVELARLMGGPELDFDLKLVLKAAEVPDCVPGSSAAPRLGWTTWLKTLPFDRDDSQVVLRAAV
jgi:type VI secretion system protein ImpH